MKKFILCLLVLCFFSVLPSNVYADAIGKTNFTVGKIECYNISEYKISGYFEVKNNSGVYYPELNYTMYLVPSDEDVIGRRINSAYVSGSVQKFSLSPFENKLVAFEIRISQIPDKLYDLGVVISDNASELSDIEYLRYLKLGKEEQYIASAEEVANYYKIKDFEDSLSGPYMEPGKSPDAYLKVKSTYKKDISVIPEYTVYRRGVYYGDCKPIKREVGEKITLKAGETKELKLKLPVMLEPESYYIKVRLLDENDKTVSGEYYFRYVVNGTTAKISSINTLYDYSKKELKIFYNIIGSSDGKTITNAEVETGILREDTGNIIDRYFNRSDILGTEYMLSFTIRVPDDNPRLTAYVRIKQGDETLAYKNITLPIEATSVPTEKFNDIKDTKYELAVKMLNSYGVISGYPDGTFRPQKTLTRAELTSIALNMLDVDISNFEVKNNAFTDVAENHWAYKSINYAYENGIINGYGNGLFKPNNEVKYSEAITILLNVAGYRDYVNGKGTTWPNNYIDVAKEINIADSNTYTDTFNFTNPATRGDVSKLALNSFILRRS